MSVASIDTKELAARNRKVAGRAVLFVLFMIGLAYASVPLYRIFCQVTGFGGTPMRADAAPGAQAAMAPVGVRFDANVNAALPWEFKQETNKTKVVPGERIVFQQDGVFLLHRADASRRAEGRDAGGVLR
jgi:cytochrome c oxidase assembly protein subunit 11